MQSELIDPLSIVKRRTRAVEPEPPQRLRRPADTQRVCTQQRAAAKVEIEALLGCRVSDEKAERPPARCGERREPEKMARAPIRTRVDDLKVCARSLNRARGISSRAVPEVDLDASRLGGGRA